MNTIRQASLPGYDLGDYIKESLDFLRKHEPPEGFFVGFSGGKDSITTLQLCALAGVKHQAFYTYTTIDPPEVVRFIRAHYPQVQWLRPAKSFFAYVLRFAPPLRTQRWCCPAIKEKPSWGIPLANRLFGIRAEESAGRAERGRINMRVIRKGRGREQRGRKVHTHFHPIFRWPEWAVWEFLDAYNVPCPSLYAEGFHRIGCVVCPYIMGKTPGARYQRSISMSRWPGMWKAFEHAVKRYWTQSSSRGVRNKSYPGETADSYWRDYLNGFEK